MLLILLALQIVQSFASNELCTMKCGSREGLINDTCVGGCEVESGNCCWRKSLIQIDLRNCALEELAADVFLNDGVLFNQTEQIERVCLDHNGFGVRNVSRDAFRGLTGLEIIVLPSMFEQCPGGDKLWDTAKRTTTSILCEGQKPPCNATGEVCPEKSHCVDNGPGLMRCQCDGGYFGYKCLKSGQFPYALFYGSLGGATVIMSAVLWFIGRRKIGLHTKQS